MIPDGLPVRVIPHGHYIDVYPNEIERAKARRVGKPADVLIIAGLPFGDISVESFKQKAEMLCPEGAENSDLYRPLPRKGIFGRVQKIASI